MIVGDRFRGGGYGIALTLCISVSNKDFNFH